MSDDQLDLIKMARCASLRGHCPVTQRSRDCPYWFNRDIPLNCPAFVANELEHLYAGNDQLRAVLQEFGVRKGCVVQ